MSRKASSFRRELSPDFRFNSVVVSKCINYITVGGKKSVAEKVFYGAMDIIKEEAEPLATFEQAVENIIPPVEVRSRRVGGSTYQIPMPVNRHRGLSLALRWMKNAIKKRSERGAHVRLAKEIMDAASNKGSAISKKEEVVRMAESNKAFAHYRW